MPESLPDARGWTERRIARAFLLVWLAWGALLLGLRVAYPGLECGDGQNDADILHASTWYAEHGYRATLFLPVRETAACPGWAQPGVYNTFPPGVFWLHELLRRAGLSELWHFRVVSIAMAQGAVWLWFVVARRLTGSAAIAAAAGTLYMLGRPYAVYAGGMWEHIPMLTLMGTLACWLGFERASAAGDRRGAVRWIVLAALMNFLDEWLTVQHGPMVAVCIGVRALVLAVRLRRSGPLIAAAVVGCMPAVVIVLRFAHQVAVSGSTRAALNYFRDPVRTRLGETDPSMTPGRALACWAFRLGLPLKYRGEAPSVWSTLYPALHPLTLLGAAAGAICLMAGRDRPGRGPACLAAANGALLLAAACTWPVVMAEHAIDHLFPVLMFMPGAALVLGGLVAALADAAAGPARGRAGAAWTGMARRAVAGLALLAMAAPFARALSVADTLNRAVRLDARTREQVVRRAERFEALARTGGGLAPSLRASRMRAVRLAPRQPAIARQLGLPFYQVMVPGEVPFKPDEAVALDLADRPTRLRADRLALVAGIPDLAPDAALAVFPARAALADARTRTVCADEPLDENGPLRLREARWAWSPDGAGASAAVLIEGDAAERGGAGRWLVATLEDDAGRIIASRVAPVIPKWAQAPLRPSGKRGVTPGGEVQYGPRLDRAASLVWVEFSVDEAARAARVRFEVGGLGGVARRQLDLGRPRVSVPG